ncbi:hypothetical protein FNV43_RR14134 [Rhamnella rubrinervis]|uniref:TF-B3 domain-containing protein n=1 Tax=Rhamnella rubrinervis TaxID=2594499 RepID=A0A8K0MG17_9ROSA|nr:hypothetical protein FNV43_RR14134 [Rhamnella rubrinervis]
MVVKSFKKKLVSTDLNQKLSVPSKKYRQLFPSLNNNDGRHAVEFEARDKSGAPWKFTCSIRKKGHPKPVINSKGWRQFVRAKGLKEGNEIIFSKHPPRTGSGTSYYTIDVVRKKVPIFGILVDVQE